MNFNLDGKVFQITLIQGPKTEVNEDTKFYFHQEKNVISAEYSGGKVKIGRLLGTVNGNRLQHRYIQINLEDQINSGEGKSELSLNESQKIQILENWEWQSQDGVGKSIMTEL